MSTVKGTKLLSGVAADTEIDGEETKPAGCMSSLLTVHSFRNSKLLSNQQWLVLRFCLERCQQKLYRASSYHLQPQKFLSCSKMLLSASTIQLASVCLERFIFGPTFLYRKCIQKIAIKNGVPERSGRPTYL